MPLVMIGGGLAEAASIYNFTTVVNNGEIIPETSRLFNSYNQPSVNGSGLVVFRARSQGGQGQPSTGIFTRDMSNLLNRGAIIPIATRDSVVPQPNNTTYPPNNSLATFNEFPSFPRIDIGSNMVATRGQSQPVWTYFLNDGTETRVGTAGIYTNPRDLLITGASQLGNVPEFPYFQVPGSSPGTRFDQFPGAPSPTNSNTIVFKGNWTDLNAPIGQQSKTGVYFRDVLANGGTEAVQLIADSNTLIPGQAVNFGSTAPPSSANGKAVFLGVDNEETPTLGGIYLSSLFDNPTNLTRVVSIGDLSSLVGDGGLKSIGEGLSFDGKNVAYWGAWGTDTFSQIVSCPEEGNAALLNYCLAESNNPNNPNGLGNGQFQFDILKNQGFFVTNTETLDTSLIAQTGDEFTTFLSLNFSGRAPGEEDEGELARWRTAAFVAIDGLNTVFKGTKGLFNTDDVLQPLLDGIYAQLGIEDPLMTIAETGMDGSVLDPEAAGLPITSLGIERDGFRNEWLALTASMANEEDSWAGVYVTETSVPEPSILPVITLSSIIIGFRSVFKRQLKNKQK
jgi:hypothetical protein